MIADRTAYDDGILAITKQVSVTSLRTAGTHDPIQRVEFMHAPKLYVTIEIVHKISE